MATNFRIPFKNAVIAQGLPTGTAAGAKAGDPVRNGGLNGANLWGTAKGEGVPKTGTYGMIALDGVIVTEVNVAVALKENDPIYITAANALTTVASGNTVFGYADEPSATGAAARIGVRISNAIGA